MNIYAQKQRWKLILLGAACIIGVSSLYYTNVLVSKLSFEERKKVELWAKATRELVNFEDTTKDASFAFEVMQDNRTIPIILADSLDHIIAFRNLDSVKSLDPKYLAKQLRIMKEQNEPIVIEPGFGIKNYIYFRNSVILQKLIIYPYIQLGVILLFIGVSYLAFSSSRKAEQNKVWVGLTKETAHQLGTPTSSLMGWIEYLKTKGVEQNVVLELDKDVKRLEKITERFSKVGSSPKLTHANVAEHIEKAVEYLSSRSSRKVAFEMQFAEKQVIIPLSPALFEWVIENICKNAIDAIEGSGKIEIRLSLAPKWVTIDINDNGKGMPKSLYKTVFKPGFTTKERGWGLGLSLAKRIVENYHRGRLFVVHSEINKGTTFRIMLRR